MENFLNMGKEIATQVQETQRVPDTSVSLVRVAGLKAPEIFAASGISPEWHMSDPHHFFLFFVW